MQAFDGIRVLDFTHVLAGPFCAYQLAVMGADVIKIEDPSEPDMMRPESVSSPLGAEGRGTRYVCQAGNKRAITVDLKTSEGRELIHKMVESCDVVISNFRNGVMDRLELDADALQKINPQLIHCTISGFGATGPKAEHPAYDNVIQAFSGLMSSTGGADTGPMKVGPPVLDYGTGAQAAFAIAAALFQRTRTNTGQRIDVSMLDAALMLMTSTVVDTHVSDIAPNREGNSSATKAAYGLFKTSQGDLMVGAFTNRQLANTFRAVGLNAIADGMSGKSMAEVDVESYMHRAVLQEQFKTRPAYEWEDILNAHQVPAARVRDLHEALKEPQIAFRTVLQPGIILPDTGTPIPTPVTAFGFANNGPKLSRDPARHGADTDEVLAEFGLSPSEITALRAAGTI